MRTAALACGLLLAVAAPARSAPPVDYNRDIRPLLSANCYACHGPDDKARKAHLRLDIRDSVLKAKVLVPGRPEESELLQRQTILPPIHLPDELQPLAISEVASRTPPGRLTDGTKFGTIRGIAGGRG